MSIFFLSTKGIVMKEAQGNGGKEASSKSCSGKEAFSSDNG